jgi:hypothetical protein
LCAYAPIKCGAAGTLRAKKVAMQSTIPIIAELVVSRLDASLYEYVIQIGDQVLFDGAGLTSIANALADAAEQGTDMLGLQLSYAGIVAGTYAPAELLENSDVVAQLCVENSGRFRIN